MPQRTFHILKIKINFICKIIYSSRYRLSLELLEETDNPFLRMQFWKIKLLNAIFFASSMHLKKFINMPFIMVVGAVNTFFKIEKLFQFALLLIITNFKSIPLSHTKNILTVVCIRAKKYSLLPTELFKDCLSQ